MTFLGPMMVLDISNMVTWRSRYAQYQLSMDSVNKVKAIFETKLCTIGIYVRIRHLKPQMNPLNTCMQAGC